MRDASEMPATDAGPVDRLLQDAGARWRTEQPEPRPIDGSLFARDRVPAARLVGRAHPWSFLAGVLSAASVLIVVALVAPELVPRLGGGGPVRPPASSGQVPGGYIESGLANCPVTKSDGSFTPTGADWDIGTNRAWYGTNVLWTLLERDGVIWRDLPRSEVGLGQKTFWWSRFYRVQDDPEPDIFVTGSRLDSPGNFGFGPGTNAAFGMGTAMLVGVEVPAPGCWNVTAHYRGAELSYVVWVEA